MSPLSSAPLPNLTRRDLALLRKHRQLRSLRRGLCGSAKVLDDLDVLLRQQLLQAGAGGGLEPSLSQDRTGPHYTAIAGAAVFACGFSLTRHALRRAKPKPCAGRGHQEAVVLLHQNSKLSEVTLPQTRSNMLHIELLQLLICLELARIF